MNIFTEIAVLCDDAVLLIPSPAARGEAFDIPEGYYTLTETKLLLLANAENPSAIHYIADMLETGDPQVDGLCAILRQNSNNPEEIARIAKTT